VDLRPADPGEVPHHGGIHDALLGTSHLAEQLVPLPQIAQQLVVVVLGADQGLLVPADVLHQVLVASPHLDSGGLILLLPPVNTLLHDRS